MKKSFFVSFLTIAIAFGLRGQTQPHKSKAKSEAASAKPSAKGGDATVKNENAKPINESNFDTSVKPTDDFFLYANGGWINRTEIPPDQTRWGSFNILIEQNHDALHAIAEKVAKKKSSDPTTKKVGDYYASGMDEKTIEAMKTKPLQDELAKIDNLKDRQ